MSFVVKFDFHLDEVLIRQTITMPNGVPFSQMTTQYTRQLFEGDSSDDESMTPDQFFDELDKIFGSNDGYMCHLQRIKYLKEENEKLKEENQKVTRLNSSHVRDLVSHLEKLEAENERLKQHIIHNYQDLHPNGDGIPHTEFFPGGRYAVEDDGTRTPYSALCGQIGEGIDELKEKNKELEEELLYRQMCVYSIDPNNRYCSPAKEDVDGFTECPQQRKILYERIGYESDDESDDEE